MKPAVSPAWSRYFVALVTMSRTEGFTPQNSSSTVKNLKVLDCFSLTHREPSALRTVISVPSSTSAASLIDTKPEVATGLCCALSNLPQVSSGVTRMRFPSTGVYECVFAMVQRSPSYVI